jgi:hypothetical protein
MRLKMKSSKTNDEINNKSTNRWTKQQGNRRIEEGRGKSPHLEVLGEHNSKVKGKVVVWERANEQWILKKSAVLKKMRKLKCGTMTP